MSDLVKKLEAEIDRLKKKCDSQAMMLRRLMPENVPGTLFIHSDIGTKDQNGMPERLLIVPTYGADFSYVYVRSDKINEPEW